MKRLALGLCALALLIGLGCSSIGGGSWEEAWKDFKGDNMKMSDERSSKPD
jgi:hypothetical protein